jgi:polyhydroxyalkanoate synthase
MIAYPGRTFGQLYHRLLKGNALVEGTFEVGDRTLDVADITAPVLVFGGANDSIAPIGAVKAAVPLLTGSRDVRFEIVPGGHLGMLTGRKARTSTWPLLDAWIEEWSEDEDAAPAATPRRTTPRKPAAKKTPAKRTPAKKATTKKTVTKKAVAKDSPPKAAAVPDPDPTGIGINPQRRYGSADSRALRR